MRKTKRNKELSETVNIATEYKLDEAINTLKVVKTLFIQ